MTNPQIKIKNDAGLQAIIRVKGGWVAGNITAWLKIPLDFIKALIRGVIICFVIVATYLIVTDNRLITVLF